MGPMGPNGIDLLSHSQTLSDLAERERISKVSACSSQIYLAGTDYASILYKVLLGHLAIERKFEIDSHKRHHRYLREADRSHYHSS